MRQEIDDIRQSSLETSSSYCQRFKELVFMAYPQGLSHVDEPSLVRVFLKGMTNKEMVKKIVEAGSNTVQDVIDLTLEQAGLQDTLARLGALKIQDPLDIKAPVVVAAPVPSQPAPSKQIDKLFTKN